MTSVEVALFVRRARQEPRSGLDVGGSRPADEGAAPALKGPRGYESAAQMSVAVPDHENCVVAPLASIVNVILPTKS